MRASTAILVVLGGLGLLAAGCKGGATSVSDSKYLLGLQHEAWDNGRKTLASDSPNLEVLRAIHDLLIIRTPRRVKKDYEGSNKVQVLEKVKSLGRKYEDEVASKLDMTGNAVRLRPGVKIEQVKEAFMELDEEYRQLEAMTGR